MDPTAALLRYHNVYCVNFLVSTVIIPVTRKWEYCGGVLNMILHHIPNTQYEVPLYC
jgi:hypothetical protein